MRLCLDDDNDEEDEEAEETDEHVHAETYWIYTVKKNKVYVQQQGIVQWQRLIFQKQQKYSSIYSSQSNN